MSDPLRVAVAGASGIGRHHAKWFSFWGCEVVAFTGTTSASCQTTARTLADLFGFAGRSYTDLETLLSKERPHIVAVCTPNAQHFEYADIALRAGCHVLCEKPLIWHPGGEGLLERGEKLIQLAQESDLCFGVCTQYAASIPQYEELLRTSETTSGEVEEFSVEMETLSRVGDSRSRVGDSRSRVGDSRSRGQVRDAREIWVDLGPHPLSLLLEWMPDGSIDTATLDVRFAGREVNACFDFLAGRQTCRCRIVVRDIDSGVPLRRFGINDFLVDVGGRDGADGVYEAVLRHGDEESVGPDFMSLLIRQFIRAVTGEEPAPLAPASRGLRNLELQLQILNASR